MIVQQLVEKNGIHSVYSRVDEESVDNDSGFVSSFATFKTGLSQKLQTTLNSEEILSIFSSSIKGFVKHDAISFNSFDGHVDYVEGKHEKSKLFYGISHDGCKIGDLTISRKNRFSRYEIALVEDCITVLFYPLRNGILYNQALLSSLSDPLTKLNNRAMLEQTLSRESLMASRHGDDFSMIIIDVDEFKSVNDNHGHQAGDYVLCQIANIMRKYGRSSDMLFRFAGDEFVITLSKTSTEGARMVADRIRDAVDNTNFSFNGDNLSVSVSLGVATLRENESISDLFSRADKSLYVAKEGGRNMVFAETN